MPRLESSHTARGTKSTTEGRDGGARQGSQQQAERAPGSLACGGVVQQQIHTPPGSLRLSARRATHVAQRHLHHAVQAPAPRVACSRCTPSSGSRKGRSNDGEDLWREEAGSRSSSISHSEDLLRRRLRLRHRRLRRGHERVASHNCAGGAHEPRAIRRAYGTARALVRPSSSWRILVRPSEVFGCVPSRSSPSGSRTCW
jgi:hypothetical protein